MTLDLREQLQKTLAGTHSLERELGGGGMSRVFVADEHRLRRKVVVKVLAPELAHGISVERFEREIQTAAALQQANIVPVLSAGDADGLPYYTMPYVEGEGLRARLARGPLSVGEAVSVLRDVARALAFAHARGVVHRDIKPDNVLLSGGAAVVTDFGIAKAISASRTASGGEGLTQAGMSLGTPAYMAPEQAAGDPDTDHRADVYAFGCLAYELLAGRPPFADLAPRRLLAAHMGETPRDVAELRPDAPPALARLVMRCLAKDPDDRPPRADDLLAALEGVTSTGGGHATPPLLLGGPAMFRKALALYAASFAAVALLANLAITGIGLPDWVFPGALVVMALGLPVVLWTGYVQRVTRRAATATPTYTPGGTPSVAGGTLAAMALRAAPHVSWYRTARGGVLALGAFALAVGAFMTTRAMGLGPAATLFGSGALSERDRLVLDDFAVSNGDSTLGHVVSFAVRSALSQSKVLNVVDEARVAATLDLMGRPRASRLSLPLAREVAAREGAKAVVDGEVATVGSGYVLTVRLLTADSARVLATFQRAGDGPKGLIDAADAVAKDLRAKAGESLRSVQASVPLWRARTASLEALRLFSEGAYYHQIDVNFERAIPFFRAAVAADSNFAEAWRRLATGLRNVGRPASEADAALARAYALRGRLPDAERALIEGSYFATGTPGGTLAPRINRDRAIEAYLRAGQWHNAGVTLESRREFARAESLLALATRDTTIALYHFSLSRVLVDQGKLDAADSAVARWRRVSHDAPSAQFGSALSLYHRGHIEEYGRAVDSLAARGRPLVSPFMRPAEALALLRGQVAAWRRAVHTRLTWDTAPARRAAPLVEQARVARILKEVGAAAADSEWTSFDTRLAATTLRALPGIDRPDLLLAAELAWSGRVPQARAVLAGYESTVRDTALLRSQLPLLHAARGAIALGERRWVEAIRDLRRGDSLPDGPVGDCAICLSLALGRAFDAAGQADSAIAQFERYLTTPYYSRMIPTLDAPSLALVHERLGQLYEARGEAGKAAAHYRAFADVWKRADPELQPRVAAARERARRLARTEPGTR